MRCEHMARPAPGRAGGRSRAFTLVEILLAFGIATLVLGVLLALWQGVSRSAGLSSDHSQALRSVTLALEYIRSDVSRMLYRDPSRDLAIYSEGRAFGVRVPESGARTDPWSASYTPVDYALRDEPGSTQAYRLVRKEAAHGVERIISGCLLQDMLVELIPPGELGAKQAFLEVTVIGLGTQGAKSTYTSSAVLPLLVLGAGGKYQLFFQED